VKKKYRDVAIKPNKKDRFPLVEPWLRVWAIDSTAAGSMPHEAVAPLPVWPSHSPPDLKADMWVRIGLRCRLRLFYCCKQGRSNDGPRWYDRGNADQVAKAGSGQVVLPMSRFGEGILDELSLKIVGRRGYFPRRRQVVCADKR